VVLVEAVQEDQAAVLDQVCPQHLSRADVAHPDKDILAEGVQEHQLTVAQAVEQAALDFKKQVLRRNLVELDTHGHTQEIPMLQVADMDTDFLVGLCHRAVADEAVLLLVED